MRIYKILQNGCKNYAKFTEAIQLYLSHKKATYCYLLLATTLFIGTIIKLGMDHHWWLPETEIVSTLKPEDIKVKLDVNNAPWYELVLLPKLGEVKAKAIVAYRENTAVLKALMNCPK